MAIEKQLNEIAEGDLAALVVSGVRESKTIEFKASLNLNDQEAKRKFLASIASFANASGGDMVFGIRAEDGVAQEVVPLSGFNPDKDTLALRDMIRSHIAPKVFGFDFRPVPIVGGFALVIRIPKTWAGAHMVTFNNDSRFYVRDNNGRRIMDVDEVRASFVGGEAISEKVKRYRQERLSNILADETPVVLNGTARFILHIVPLRAFEPGRKIDLKAAFQSGTDLRPIYSNGWSPGRDTEGYFNYFSAKDSIWSYVHLSTNGCIEAVEAILLRPRESGAKTIPSVAFERELLKAFTSYLKFLKQIDAEPPFSVMLSVLNVRGYQMTGSEWQLGHGLHPVNRDMLILPETLLDDLNANPDVVLRPMLDGVWHACGYWQSPNFTEDGKWQPKS